MYVSSHNRSPNPALIFVPHVMCYVKRVLENASFNSFKNMLNDLTIFPMVFIYINFTINDNLRTLYMQDKVYERNPPIIDQ